MFYGIGFCLLR